MLKSGRKKTKRIIYSVDHHKKVYEFQKKNFIVGQLVKFKSNTIKMVEEIDPNLSWRYSLNSKYKLRPVRPLTVYTNELSHTTLFKIIEVMHDDYRLDVNVLLEKFNYGEYINAKYLDLAQKVKKRKLL